MILQAYHFVLPFQGSNGPGGPAPVRVSFSISSSSDPAMSTSLSSDSNGEVASTSVSSSSSSSSPSSGSKIAFNYGREIFVYPYRGVKKAADLTKPIDKRIYKGTCPTCHDFGSVASVANGSVGGGSAAGGGGGGGGSATDPEVTPLLVGFTQGQIQLVDPVRKEISKLYNEEVRQL